MWTALESILGSRLPSLEKDFLDVSAVDHLWGPAWWPLFEYLLPPLENRAGGPPGAIQIQGL